MDHVLNFPRDCWKRCFGLYSIRFRCISTPMDQTCKLACQVHRWASLDVGSAKATIARYGVRACVVAAWNVCLYVCICTLACKNVRVQVWVYRKSRRRRAERCAPITMFSNGLLSLHVCMTQTWSVWCFHEFNRNLYEFNRVWESCLTVERATAPALVQLIISLPLWIVRELDRLLLLSAGPWQRRAAPFIFLFQKTLIVSTR